MLYVPIGKPAAETSTANKGDLDRNGVVLADNLTTTSLVLIPNQIKDADATSLQLAEILGVAKEEMDTHVKKETSIERVHPEGRRAFIV